jgi:hypothetical protein
MDFDGQRHLVKFIVFDGSPYFSSPFWTVQVHSLGTPLSDYSNENSDDYNILSALGMKDRDIFKGPESTNLLMKRENETLDNFKVPISGSVAGGQSPYFNVTNTPTTKSAIQDTQVVKPLNTESHEAGATPSNAVTQNEQNAESATSSIHPNNEHR